MKRRDEERLQDWFSALHRKPLVLRGARQVGKSTLVRQFAAQKGLTINEINLERHLGLDKVFASLDTRLMRAEVDALVGRSITAAGSLLEFTLARHSFAMPVGRIEYHHLGPMSFREFLEAVEPPLCRYLDELSPDSAPPEAAHQKLLLRQRQYLFVGGMPEAVQSFVETGSLEESAAVHRRIVSTYEDDFAKYAGPRERALLQHVFRQIPRLAGRKIKYVSLSREDRSLDVKAAISQLAGARVCHRVAASPCSGVPLHADIDESAFKLLFLDIGLMNHVCGMDWLALSRMDDTRLVNEGAMAEQFIGQHLAYFDSGTESPRLAYWLREGRAANAEVDYVVARGPRIFPVEVKAGRSGTLRSLQQFVAQKRTRTAIRFDLNPPSRQRVAGRLPPPHGLAPVPFDLISLPLYAVGELGRLLDDEREGSSG